MFRKLQLALVLIAVLGMVAGVFASPRIAGAATPMTPIVHPIDEPVNPAPVIRRTPPPLPLSGSATPSASPIPGAGPSGVPPPGLSGLTEVRGYRVDKNVPRPQRVPKLSQFLVKTGKSQFSVRPVMSGSMARASMQMNTGRLRPMAADGSTILLTGDQTNFFENDITLSYGQEIYLLCENMSTTDTIQYVVYPPDGSGPYTSNNVAVGANSGNNACRSYGQFDLSTPFGGFGGSGVSGTAYPGVWVVATYDTVTGQLTSETNIIASSALNFTTYADVAESTPSLDFGQGSTIAVGATGLNPNHFYAVGWVYTSGGGQPCVYSVPSVGSGKTGVCFTGTASGVQAFSGNFEQWWNSSSSPSTSSAATGTYDVELYDTTTSEMIGHQQISMEPSTASWTLTPYSSTGATPPPGMAYNNIFATDGLTDNSTTGLTYNASGLAATSNGDTIAISIANPNGVVLTSPNTNVGYPIQNALTVNNTTTQSGGSISKQIAFPLDFTEQMAYGPTQNPFAPNVYSAQLYDKNKGAVIGTKSFQILAYAAGFSWAGGTVVNAAPGGGVTESVTITNTGNQNYGTWNGDGINGIEIAPNGSYNEQLNGPTTTTATDTAGNVWNLFTVGSGKNLVIYAEPQSLAAGASLPVGSTLTFSIIIQVANGQCTSSPCYFDTAIRPRHGVAYSAVDSASNALGILANGVPPSSVVATATWAVQSETSTANMAARVGKFSQLAYILGTANASSADNYKINLTINNASSPGGHKMMDVKVVMPSVLDMNASPPTIVSSPTGTGSWSVITNSGNSALGGANVFELTCNPNTRDSCGISSGSTGTFSLNFPLFSGSFVEQDTAMTANFDGGGCGNCNATSYTLNATNTKVNGIAGLTNIDSMMLGGFSLNPTLMFASFSPNSVGTGVATSATLVFNNTSTAQDPNPDYVDQINLVFPATINPNSITVPSGWVATQTSTNNWQIALCAAPTNAAPCSTSESNAIAPGGSLTMTLNYNSPGPTAGTYSVTWYATGANGGEDTHAIATTATVTFSATSASVAFTTVNGVTVPSGTEPQTGTDVTTNGTTFIYRITNTGANPLNSASIVIPNVTRGNTSGADSTGKYWTITSAPTVALSSGSSGTAGTCSGTLNAAQYSSATASSSGAISLSGCTVPSNGVITVTFTAQTPYLIGSDFLFSATVKSGAAQVTAQPSYSSSNAMLIVINGGLTILTPGNGTVNAGNVLTAATGSGATPATSCTGCGVTIGSPTLIDFGAFSGTFTATDIVDASVMSDANSPNSWTLYISAGTNPSNMLYAQVHTASSSSATNLTYSATSMTLVPTTSPGLQLTTYTGTGRHAPSDTIQNFQVQTGGNTSPQNVTITYTLVFN